MLAGIRPEIQGIYFMIENRLFNELITIRKPVQVMSENKVPTIDWQTIESNIKARFEPLNNTFNRNVLGNVAKQSYRVFMNLTEIKPNYEVIRQSDNAKFIVTDVKDFFGHHIEVIIEEKKCSG